MYTVEQCIRELLFEQDCVIIPDFGGFITQYKSAVIDHLGQVIYPPTKSISFNRQLRNDDGLLTNTFSQLNNVSFVEASVAVKVFSENFSDILNKNNRNTLEKVGVFSRNESGLISFDFTGENYLSESYGLPVVTAIAIQRAQLADEIINQLELSGNSNYATQSAPSVDDFEHDDFVDIKSKKTAKYSVSTISLFGLSLLLLLSSALPFTNVNVPQLNLNEAGVYRLVSELFVSNKEINIAPIAIDGNVSKKVSPTTQLNLDKPLFVAVAKSDELKIESPKSEPTNSSEAIGTELKYLVVAGVFKEKANAERLYKNLSQQNIDAKVTEVKRGKVTYIGFDGGFSESAAATVMNKAKHQSIECWVKKM